jgi:hypothetical protein
MIGDAILFQSGPMASRRAGARIVQATENAAVVQALIDNLIERGLDPNVCRLFIIDGAKALSKVIRRTFGAHTPIQRCQSELRLQLTNPSTSPNELNTTLTPDNIIHGDACFAYFNKIWGIPRLPASFR